MSLPPEAAIAHVIVGVAGFGPVRELWCDIFGLEEAARRDGPDAELASAWGLREDAIDGQLLLRTPGAQSGWLHVVRFASPGAPVRKGAAATDSCPKNLDVNCIDMDARVAALKRAGFGFRSAISDYTIGGISAREVQMPAHDDTNVVLIEVDDWPVQLSPQHYGAVTSFVMTVPDTVAEGNFYRELFGMEPLLEHRITGEAIEKVVGLPPGAALDLRLLGSPDNLYGRVELICYEGLSGANLYPRARPPATGALGCRLRVASLGVLRERASAGGYAFRDCGVLDAVFGRVQLAQLESPAGCLVEAFEAL